jgi:hypothetical protein
LRNGSVASANSSLERIVLPTTRMSLTKTRTLPNGLSPGSSGGKGTGGRTWRGGGVGRSNSFRKGAGGSPDRPVGSKMGGIGAPTWARAADVGNTAIITRLSHHTRRLLNRVTSSCAGSPAPQITIHNLPTNPWKGVSCARRASAGAAGIQGSRPEHAPDRQKRSITPQGATTNLHRCSAPSVDW